MEHRIPQFYQQIVPPIPPNLQAPVPVPWNHGVSNWQWHPNQPPHGAGGSHPRRMSGPIEPRRILVPGRPVKTPPSLPRTMPGVYEIEHIPSKMSVDFDHKTEKPVIGLHHNLHSNDRKKSEWEFICLGIGWMIKSVYKDLYLNIDQGTVVANGFPAAWKVEEVEVGVVRITWSGTGIPWNPEGMGALRSSDANEPIPMKPGTEILLGENTNPGYPGWVCWRLLPAKTPPSVKPSAPPHDRVPPPRGSGSGSDTDDFYTITRTTTKTRKLSSPDGHLSPGELGSDVDTDGSCEITKRVTETKKLSLHEVGPLDISSSDADTDGSYTVTKRVTKTRKFYQRNQRNQRRVHSPDDLGSGRDAVDSCAIARVITKNEEGSRSGSNHERD